MRRQRDREIEREFFNFISKKKTATPRLEPSTLLRKRRFLSIMLIDDAIFTKFKNLHYTSTNLYVYKHFVVVLLYCKLKKGMDWHYFEWAKHDKNRPTVNSATGSMQRSTSNEGDKEVVLCLPGMF